MNASVWQRGRRCNSAHCVFVLLCPKQTYQLENIDFGRRMAVEREVERDPAAPSPNCVFDQSGNFIVYPTHLGIKVRSRDLHCKPFPPPLSPRPHRAWLHCRL